MCDAGGISYCSLKAITVPITVLKHLFTLPIPLHAFTPTCNAAYLENTHGLPGRNIPCDLHMEYLNRAAKESLRGLGSNITDNAVKRVGKSIG